jgi:formiminotetrahydrofolate cyclodeaminase
MDLNLFFADLASDKPVPGGGSASAVSAALSASLLEMVVKLSVGKAEGEPHEIRFHEILDQLKAMGPELLLLAEKDAQGYDAVIKAFRLPKKTEEEKRTRAGAIQDAFNGAIQPPLTLMKKALYLLEFTEFILKNGNPNAFSDAGVAFYLTGVAFNGGKMNVLINLDSLKDAAARTSYLNETRRLEENFNTMGQRIEAIISGWITDSTR